MASRTTRSRTLQYGSDGSLHVIKERHHGRGHQGGARGGLLGRKAASCKVMAGPGSSAIQHILEKGASQTASEILIPNYEGVSETDDFNMSVGIAHYEKFAKGNSHKDHSQLNQRDHLQITRYLSQLSSQELINLGLRLGLRYPTLKKMNQDSLLNDMVHAWLRRDDDVIEGSGEPSWKSLSEALEDCGNKGIASDIREHIKDGKQPKLLVTHFDSDKELSQSFDRLQVCTGQYDDTDDDDDDDDPYEEFSRYRLSTIENSPVVEECKLMDDHVSYHGAITGKEAEQRLKTCGDHCYLTRYSEAKQCYMLTIYKKKPKEKVKHFELSFLHSGEQKVYKIDGKTRIFNGINEMLMHYENSRIDPAFRTIGRSITEQEYLEARFTAEVEKQQVLDEALKEAESRFQEALLEAELQKQRELEEVKRQKQQELAAAEQRRLEDVAKAKKHCTIL